jgi:hypothetical protein
MRNEGLQKVCVTAKPNGKTSYFGICLCKVIFMVVVEARYFPTLC